MMMMQNSDDTLFADLLSSYSAPVEDDGFTQALMADIKAAERRLESLRRIAICAACFIGGMIAASQLPALGGIIANMNLSLPPSPSALPVSLWTLTGMVLLGLVLWTALDRKASDIF